MANFRTKKRFETKLGSLKVDAGLPVGRYTFQLTAVDKSGNKSKLAKLKVEVVAGGLVIDPRLIDPRIVNPRIVAPSPTTPIQPIRPIPTIRN
jgi:hypothetical protein